MNERDMLRYASKLVDELRGPSWYARLQELVALGEAARPAVLEGLKHGSWQVRRACATYLDHYGDPASLAALVPLLRDPKSSVRMHAAHALGCDQCKDACLPIDPIPHLIERIVHDESIRVRRQSLTTLVWTRPRDPRILEVCERVLACESDRRMRLHAAMGVLKARELGPSPRALEEAQRIAATERARSHQRSKRTTTGER